MHDNTIKDFLAEQVHTIDLSHRFFPAKLWVILKIIGADLIVLNFSPIAKKLPF